MKTIIIAEAGVNHNGELDLAKELIKIASESGADYVKFQTFSVDKLVTKNALKASYQLSTKNKSETQYSMLKKLELSEQDHRELLEECRSKSIGFLSTGFDSSSINLLISLGIELIKIPSGEINNLPLLRFIGQLSKSVLLSTGMSTMDEIESALKILEQAGTGREKITVLHCTSAYPTPVEDVNLLALKSIQDKFKVSIGFSDHTLDTEIPLAAVALGASVIEKHFTLSRKLDGPDHSASLEPHELKSMISSIRKLEIALGDGIKKPMPSESENISVARRSIVASRSIINGENFTLENLITKRPGNGLSPMVWDELIGSKATKNYAIDDLINEP
jgi:N,N'-diacetyllegionaminate synthase